jgi:hypothetical protein
MSGEDLTTVVEVELDQQQDSLLQRMRATATYGTTDEEVIRNLFRRFLQEQGMLAGSGR